MKRINPLAFRPLKAGKPVAMSRDVEIRLEKPGCVWAVWDGGETVIGYGTHIDVTLTGAFYVKAQHDGSYYTAPDAVVAASGDAPFTNEDKRPNHSATMEFVMREMRKIRNEKNLLLRQMARAKTLTPPAEAEPVTETVDPVDPVEVTPPPPEPEDGQPKRE